MYGQNVRDTGHVYTVQCVTPQDQQQECLGCVSEVSGIKCHCELNAVNTTETKYLYLLSLL